VGVLAEFRYRKISQSTTVNDLLKEFFRKSIHLCAGFIPLFASVNRSLTMILLSAMLVFYIAAETLRLHGIYVPVISRVTAIAARKRDQGKFVLGPVTLSIGILLALFFFQPQASCLGIMALAFGDGIASLAGKLFGRREIPWTGGKTFEGSVACFFAVLVSSLLILRDIPSAFALALFAAVIELLPLGDFDNIVIPVCIAGGALLLAS